MHIINDITGKIERAKSLSFGDIFNSSVETFKKVWLQGFVTYVLNVLLIAPLFIILYIPLIFFGILSPDSFGDDIDLNGVSVTAGILTGLLFLVLLFAASALSLGFKAAFYRIIREKDLGLNTSDNYFFFFKKQYLSKTIGLSLSMLGMVLLSYILCVLPLLYLIVPLYYMTIIYALNPDMSNAEIIQAGFKLGNKKWLLSFGLLFVSAILSGIVGFLMCIIGVYVTRQFVDLPCYHIYKEVVGLDEVFAIDNIETSQE
ncbi:hypothetical protein [Algibacter mikhailovii]|uniref:DUF975 family protein n=1 Tax=Algibacter mikhailovii TaxID=425498 RepID=A0A918QTJ1_9FLAO|nr:hypothetical protein [Algibacter mikhailovii]GGZ72718.1 hypothetical protein GCM10007028_07180 [Algibacter mikhailovii]